MYLPSDSTVVFSFRFIKFHTYPQPGSKLCPSYETYRPFNTFVFDYSSRTEFNPIRRPFRHCLSNPCNYNQVVREWRLRMRDHYISTRVITNMFSLRKLCNLHPSTLRYSSKCRNLTTQSEYKVYHCMISFV